ncbi:helix-turn-helix transcriptional regulator [Pseudoalteromonas sp. SYSU M81236]|uniref:helix-turn-helix transcriptional regulator n=1 Tax=Pseudoalteromonas sp. SYSU M81236 TaxID=3447014 RepID=UPI003F00B8A0
MTEAIIRFKINNDSLTLDDIDDCLFEAGFDDAIISHSGGGNIAIELCRKETNYKSLVASVVAQVTAVIPSAKIIQASYDTQRTSQMQRPTPFKSKDLDNLGVDAAASRIRSPEKLKFIAEIKDDYIINIPDGKEVPHPARYFEGLFLHKLKAQGLGNNDLSKMLDLPVEQYDDFLKGKKGVTVSLAERLEATSGMPREFWLRAQRKFDNSHK